MTRRECPIYTASMSSTMKDEIEEAMEHIAHLEERFNNLITNPYEKKEKGLEKKATECVGKLEKDGQIAAVPKFQSRYNMRRPRTRSNNRVI